MTHALVAIASAHATCPAVTAQLVSVPCTNGADQSADLLRDELAREPIAAVQPYPSLGADTALFAAGIASGATIPCVPDAP